MKTLLRRFASVVLALSVASSLSAQDRPEKPAHDIFDYAGQKEATGVKKIVFVADTASHGARGNHEFVAGAIYLARQINKEYPNAWATVYTIQHWPKDLTGIDDIVVLLNDGGSAVNPAVKKAIADGAGFMAIHYGVEVSKGERGDAYLKWMGGFFETFWSVNPHWTANFKEIPKHETTRGVKPFTVNDEWYYHMRFIDGMVGVTPILYDLPPLSTLESKPGVPKKTDSHGFNPDVYKNVKDGRPQVMAWAYDRLDGGRGFGFTGYHNHANLGNDSFRTLLLNAVAWTAKLPVPEGGVASTPLNRDQLESLIDEAKLAPKKYGI
jgi:hypothetical protein